MHIFLFNSLTGPMRICSVTASALFLLGGCVSQSSPNHESRFGDVGRTLRAQQIIDPDAPRRNTTLAPVDGKVAAGAQKNYAESHGYTVKESKPASIQIPTQASQ